MFWYLCILFGDREPHKEEVLSDHEHTEARILLLTSNGKAANSSSLGDGLYYQTGKVKKITTKKERQRGLPQKNKGIVQVG